MTKKKKSIHFGFEIVELYSEIISESMKTRLQMLMELAAMAKWTALIKEKKTRLLLLLEIVLEVGKKLNFLDFTD